MKKFGVLVLVLAPVFAGCSGAKPKESANAGPSYELEQLNERFDRQSMPIVEVSNDIYIGAGEVLPFAREVELPKAFRSTYTINEALTLPGIAKKITQLTGIPVRLPVRAGAQGDSSDEGGDSAPDLAGAMMLAGDAGDGVVDLEFNGSLMNLLDTVSAQMGIGWKYVSGEIRFLNMETRSYVLPIFRGKGTIKSRISTVSNVAIGEGESSSGQSSGELTLGTESEVNAWEEVEKSIKSVLSSKGVVSISQTSGLVTVTDAPTVLDEVDKIVGHLKSIYSRQVAVTAKLYSLTIESANDYGWDLRAIYKKLNDEYGVAASGIGLDASSGGMTATVLNPPNDKSLFKYSGSELLVKAMRSQGALELRTSASSVGMSGYSMPIQNIREITYLKKPSVTTGEEGTSTELEPGELTVGFTVSVTPVIQKDNRILLSLDVQYSALESMEKIVSNDLFINAPEVIRRSFSNQVAVRNGATLVMAGLVDEQDGKQGTTGLLGFSRGKTKTKTVMVLTLTANLVEGG